MSQNYLNKCIHFYIILKCCVCICMCVCVCVVTGPLVFTADCLPLTKPVWIALPEHPPVTDAWTLVCVCVCACVSLCMSQVTMQGDDTINSQSRFGPSEPLVSSEQALSASELNACQVERRLNVSSYAPPTHASFVETAPGCSPLNSDAPRASF